MQPVAPTVITTTSTSTTTTMTTNNEPVQRNRPTSPILQSRSESKRSAVIKALLNEQNTGAPPLHQAIADGDFELAKVLLASGAWVKTEIRPPIRLEEELTAKLFSLGRPKNFREKHGADAKQERNKCVVDLVVNMEQAAPQWRIRNTGANALTLALLCNAPLDFIEHLLAVSKQQFSAIVDQADAIGRTPISIAIEHGDPALITLLLENGACAHSDTKIEAALDLCVNTGQPQLLPLFLQISDTSKKVFFNGIQRHVESLVTKDFTSLSKLLKAVHFFLTDDDIATLLVTVAKIPGTSEKLPVLYGLIRNRMTNDQLEALREAAANSNDLANYRYVRERDHFLSATLRSPLAASDPSLKRELIRAIKIGDQHFVNLLLKKGIDIAIGDPVAEAAGLAAIAANLRDPALMDRLSKGLSVGGKTALNTAPIRFKNKDYSKVASEDVFMQMLTVDQNVSTHPKACGDLLLLATEKNYARCVDYLLQSGTPAANMSVINFPSMARSQPIVHAILNENADIARALLNAGARLPDPSYLYEARRSDNPEFRELFDNLS